ncbi:uncharacterized protein LOC117111218 [Anneissia japonica]|uniref:uncharacterized protein LOC117111218 n=1 Tax=Anneissia japonica TaxID=1529436 RepID=UPI001425A755|nr:uncharacterized protein LOC117111218 [Anneissia japonica]
MAENGKNIGDDLSESSQKNGTRKKHVQLQFMENNNSEDWHGTRLSLLSHIHVDYRNIERTLSERPSFSIAAQTGANDEIDLDRDEPSRENYGDVDQLNGDVSNNGPLQNRQLNGTCFFLADTNRRDRLMTPIMNGTHVSQENNTTCQHAKCDEQRNCDCKRHEENVTTVVVDDLCERNILDCASLPDTSSCQNDANQFDLQHTSHESGDGFRLHPHLLPEQNLNSPEPCIINHMEDEREIIQNGHDHAEGATNSASCSTENRTSDMFQNNLDPLDAVSEENHVCCGLRREVSESVLNVISGDMHEDSDEIQHHENTECDLEIELNNLLLEDFSENGCSINAECENGFDTHTSEKSEDVDSDLDAGNQDNTSSSSSSDIVDDMIMNLEMGPLLQVSSSGAVPTCLARANSSEDSDEGLEADVCDDVSEREEEANIDDVEKKPLDDGDDDGCLDVWDMPQAIALESEEQKEEGQCENISESFQDNLPESYRSNDREHSCRNGNDHDADLNELFKHHSDTQGAAFFGDFPRSGHHNTSGPFQQSFGNNANSFDELSIAQGSLHGSSINSFPGVSAQSSHSFRQTISEDTQLYVYEPCKIYKTDDEESLDNSSNVSDSEYGCNHLFENSHKKHSDNPITSVKTPVNHSRDYAISGNENDSQCNRTSVIATFRDEKTLSESVRNCRLFEESLISVNNESRSLQPTQRQYFSLATGGSVQNPSNFPHNAQADEEQEDEKHSEKRLLLQEVKDQMALQMRRLDDRRREELHFEEVLQAEFGVEEQDDIDLDDEDDELRTCNFIGVGQKQEETIGSEEESTDIEESFPFLPVDDIALQGVEGACGCSNDESFDHVVNDNRTCKNRNCRVWHNLITSDNDIIEDDEFLEARYKERQKEHNRREDIQQPFIVWRRSLLRGDNESIEFDQMNEMEEYVIDRHKEFVVRKKHQTNPPDNERRCATDTEEREFNHNQNNNEEDIDSPESLEELQENILRDRLLALKQDDGDAPVWHGLHPINVIGASGESSAKHQAETTDVGLDESSAHGFSMAGVLPFPLSSESLEDQSNIVSNGACKRKESIKINQNIVQVNKQKTKPIEDLPPNSSFVWTPRKALRKQECHSGPYPSLQNAVKNALVALGYNPILNPERDSTQHMKDGCSTVSKLLISSRKHFGLPEDISSNIAKHSNGEVFSRFFSFFPQRNVNLYKWLKDWISLGVVPIASINPQVAISSDSPIPKEWRHQMIYGVDEEQAYLCTPNIRLRYQTLMAQLSSDSILLVAREDVVNRWDRWSRLGELKHPPDNDCRWIRMNVLGQVVNMMREQSAPKPHEDYSRRYYYKPLKQRRTTHIRIPTRYKGGITLCIRKEDKKACEAVQNAPELPLMD